MPLSSTGWTPRSSSSFATRIRWTDHYSRRFHELVEAAGLRQIRLHDVRHSVASLFLESGQPPHVVAAILGHGVRTLLATYTHSNAVAAALAVDALAGVLGGASDISAGSRDITAAAQQRKIGS